MDHIQLKLSDEKGQLRLETIIGQLDWKIIRRSVGEDRNMPPMLTYLLEDGRDHERLLEHIKNINYGFAQEPLYTDKGGKKRLQFVVRQLFPTQTGKRKGIATFGDGNNV